MTSAKASLSLSTSGRAVLEVRARERKQKDQLCGAFCAAIAITALTGKQVTQDAAARVAGTRLSAKADPDGLPPGESPRTDYLEELPLVDDPAVVGTSAHGVAHAVAVLSEGALDAIPLSGRWNPESARLLVDLAREPDHVVILNTATRPFWNSHTGIVDVFNYLDGKAIEPRSSEWDVGHFILLAGSLSIDGGDRQLALCADTYPTLGSAGVYVQPLDAIAAGLNRDHDPNSTGGVLVVVPGAQAKFVRARAHAAGLRIEFWDNGSPNYIDAPNL